MPLTIVLRHLVRRSILLLSLGTASVVRHGVALGDDKADCIAVSEEAQSLAAHHRLVAARRKFGECVRDACPAVILQDCAEQIRRLDESLASVVLVAMTSDGRELSNVRVAMDGAPWVDALDGRAIPVDPGPHRWSFTNADGKTESVDLVVEEGMKRKRVAATFVVPIARVPVSPLAWILGGVGVACLGVGTLLGAETLAEKDSLYTTSDRDAFLLKEHVVDVAFGVGVVSLAIATWLVATRPLTSASPVTRGAEDGARAGFAF